MRAAALDPQAPPELQEEPYGHRDGLLSSERESWSTVFQNLGVPVMIFRQSVPCRRESY